MSLKRAAAEAFEADMDREELLARLAAVDKERDLLLKALNKCDSTAPRDISEFESDGAHVKRLLMGYEISSLMVVAHRLGIATVLGPEEMCTSVLAQRLCVEGVGLLDSVLCMLAANGVFHVTSREDEQQGILRLWRNNGLSLALQNMSIRPSSFDYIIKRSLLYVDTAIREGSVPCRLAHGKSFWEVAVDPEIDYMMERLFEPHITGLLNCLDWSLFPSVVDVGGGLGHVLSSLLAHCPSMRGILFDQPHTIDRAQASAKPEEKSRLQYVAGDFFEHVPSADALLLRWVLHNWTDSECIKILSVCAKALTFQGRLLVLEHVVPLHGCLPHAQLCAQLIGGTERTETEWRLLLAKAGFRVLRVVPVGDNSRPLSSLSMIEATRFA